MSKHITTLISILFFVNYSLTGQVFVKSDGNVALGADSTDHPLEIHSPETAFDTFDIVLGILAESSKRPTIQFAELDPIRATSGMSIEYDGRLTGTNNRLHIRGVDGSVQYTFKSFASFGVGTDNPNGGIHVVHNSPNAFTSPNIRVTEKGYDFARIKFDNTDMPGALWDIAGLADTLPEDARLNFFYGRESPFIGRNVMSLTGEGNVGIGTTEADARLHILFNSGTFDPHLLLTDAFGPYSRIKFESNLYDSSFWDVAASPEPANPRFNLFYFQEEGVGGDFWSLTNGWIDRFSTRDSIFTYYNANGQYRGQVGFFNNTLRLNSFPQSGNISLWTANAERVFIDSDGFVGIGTNSPFSPLEVFHSDKPALTLTKENEGVTEFTIRTDGPTKPFWRHTYNIDSDPTRCEYNMWFHPTDSTLRNVLRIDDLGQVGIGNIFPTNQLDVKGTGSFIAGTDIVLGIISDGSNRPAIQFSSGPAATSTSGMSIEYHGGLIIPRLSFRSDAATDVFRFTNNGDAFKPGGGNWSVLSDQRMKKDIESYDKGLDDIIKIRPVSFSYTPESGFPVDQLHVGVIAQELQEVAPSMVSEIEVEQGQKYLTVDNSEMVYMLINAVKELSEQNEEQQALIRQLLNSHEELEEQLKTLQSKASTDD